jgi:pimeloyl-ACP methyl ester carboxylesterase
MAAELKHHTLNVNGIRMHVAEQGTGPLVLMCHGWPELWYSWRHQLPAVAAAGFRAVAPDMRGFGETEAPADVNDYSIMHTVGDVVGLVSALGEKKAIIVGHDWGAPVAWTAAMMRPDLFPAVVAMSVPHRPRSAAAPLQTLRDAGLGNFYWIYFQKPGVAEAEFERDPAVTLRKLLYGVSGDVPIDRCSCTRVTAFCIRWPCRSSCRRGCATRTSRSSRASIAVPAFAADSTGIATSIATGR